MNNAKQKLLDQIRTDILKNNVCADLAKSAKNLVMGEGSPDAEVIFIGEAPGKTEDDLGRPFVGAAGKFLDEMLGSASLKREEVFITSILKYRPPNNRDPLPQEKDEFWPYLLRQLKVIQPKLVVTLGRHSMEYFLPNQKISAIHGQPKRRGDLVIMPLFHPAAALYNGSMRQTLLHDFIKIPIVLDKLRGNNKI